MTSNVPNPKYTIEKGKVETKLFPQQQKTRNQKHPQQKRQGIRT